MTRTSDVNDVHVAMDRAMAGRWKFTADCRAAFEEAVAPYLGPDRWYHDISHIAEMVNWLLANAPSGMRGDLVLAAIFHDYVDPSGGGAAVDASAVAWKAWAAKYGDIHEGDVIDVEQSILHTQGSHTAADPMFQWLIDADLLRFATGDWRRWVAEIRCEYLDAPAEAYRANRKAFLTEFAKRDPFFYHATDLEAAARASLAEQIEALG